MVVDTYDWSIRETIYATWDRLPPEVRRQLDGVRFTTKQHARKAYASAGHADIDIRELPYTTAASIGIIAHELGHVAAKHYQRLHSGEISEDDAEREADALARRWGFGAELDARRMAVGR